MRRMLMASLAPIFAFWSPVAAEQIAGSDFSSGNWSGAAYTFETGEFSHCVIAAPYVRGETLFFSMTSDGHIVIGVTNPTWNMQVGEEIDVGIYVDKYSPDFAKAEVIEKTMARVILPASNSIVQKIRLGHVMRIDTVQGGLDFSLAGTAKALDRTLNCATHHIRLSKTRPSVPGTKEHTESPDLPIGRDELVIIMTNVLNQSGISGYKVLLKTEIPEELKFYPVVWTKDETIGTANVIRLSDQTINDYSSLIVATDARGCAEDFASGTSPSSDKSAVRIFTACATASSRMVLNYSLIQSGDLVFVFAAGGTYSLSQDSPDQSDEVVESVLRNASFIVQER